MKIKWMDICMYISTQKLCFYLLVDVEVLYSFQGSNSTQSAMDCGEGATASAATTFVDDSMKLHSMKRLSNYPARERGISQTHYTLYTTRRRRAVAQKRVTEWHRFARAPGSSVAAVFLTHFSEEGGVGEIGPAFPWLYFDESLGRCSNNGSRAQYKSNKPRTLLIQSPNNRPLAKVAKCINS